MEEKTKVGVFGYASDHVGLKRIKDQDKYYIWDFDRYHVVATYSAMKGDVPDVMVINPACFGLIEPYLGALSKTTILVCRTQPFKANEINLLAA